MISFTDHDIIELMTNCVMKEPGAGGKTDFQEDWLMKK